MPLIIYCLGGGHTDTHIQHTNIPTSHIKVISENQRMPGQRMLGLKTLVNVIYAMPSFMNGFTAKLLFIQLNIRNINSTNVLTSDGLG